MRNSTDPRHESSAPSIPKAPTGIPGIDSVLLGGLPRGRTTLVGGGPGTGKTVLGLEFLYRGALAGEPGIFVTFEEQASAIRRNALAMGWDIDSLERDGKLCIIQADLPSDIVRSGDFDVGGLLAILEGQIKALGAQRIAIDALDVLLRIFSDPHRQENQLYALHDWLLGQAQTALLTVKSSDRIGAAHDTLDYMVDCVLRLDHRVLGQVTTRRMRVLKYRGTGFLSNEYPFVIASGGMVLMPIAGVELAQAPLGPHFSTGVNGLDELFDGGLRRGASILVAGASGTGKTTMVCSLAARAASRDERVLYLGFEEGMDRLVSSMLSPGIDLRPAIDAEQMRVLTAMPEAMGVEEHLLRIFQAIEAFQPKHVIVDAISACRRMGSDAAAFDFLVRLLTHTRSRGITCFYVSQSERSQLIHDISGDGISSLVDTIIVLEQSWPNDSHRRRLLIVKSRGSRHSHSYHAFRITDHGIEVGVATSSNSDVPGHEDGSV